MFQGFWSVLECFQVYIKFKNQFFRSKKLTNIGYTSIYGPPCPQNAWNQFYSNKSPPSTSFCYPSMRQMQQKTSYIMKPNQISMSHIQRDQPDNKDIWSLIQIRIHFLQTVDWHFWTVFYQTFWGACPLVIFFEQTRTTNAWQSLTKDWQEARGGRGGEGLWWGAQPKWRLLPLLLAPSSY